MFLKGLAGFDRAEDFRGKLHPLAVKLFCAGYTVEASMLILATWNTAGFRFVGKTFLLDEFRERLNRQIQQLQPLSDYTLETINLDSHGTRIQTSFDCLNYRGIGATGSSKVLHLINPKLFVMWDAYIRGEKTKKDYKTLLPDVTITKYRNTGSDYVRFLSDCKAYVSFTDSRSAKTAAKQIDEVNYYYITLPMLKLERKREEKNKKRRRAEKQEFEQLRQQRNHRA